MDVIDRCSMCEYFDWDMYDDGEDNYAVIYCKAGNRKHVGVDAEPCEMYIRED